MNNRCRGAAAPCEGASLSSNHPLSPCPAMRLANEQAVAIGTLMRSPNADLPALLDHAKMLWFFLDCAVEGLGFSSAAACTLSCKADVAKGDASERRAP